MFWIYLHKLLPSGRTAIIVVALLASAQSASWGAAPRRIAVLEYRAGVRAAHNIADVMAQQLAALTPHHVISPRDARRRLGAAADARIAQCQGRPLCVAKIGADLGTQEVILIGVSELGDVIMAIQRIAVPSGRVLARLADTIGKRPRIRVRAARRFLRRLLPPDEFKRYGKIVISTRAVGDTVTIDGRGVGRTPLRPVVVPAPGRYTVRITRPGHVPFSARFDVLPESSVEVRPTLSPVAIQRPISWYERWWVWTLVGAIAAGATAGLVVGLSDSPTNVPAVVRLPP